MRRRWAAVAAAAALALAGCGGADPPAEDAAALVPAERALAYVHVSTAAGREQDDRLAERLGRFESYRRLRDRVLRAFSPRLDFGRDVRPWLGGELALALLDNGTAQANTLLLAAVADRSKAEAFLRRVAGRREPVPYRRVVLRRFGSVAAAFVGDFLAVGQVAAVRLAIDREQGTGRRLSDLPAYRRATAGRPAGRTVDAWLAPGGVRRVLRPQGGLLGVAAELLDHPRLVGVGATLAATDAGVRATVRVARDGPAAREFEPQLIATAPEGAALYAGLAGLDAAAGLLPGAGAASLLEQLRAALPATAGVELDRDLLAPLRGEVALSLTPGLLVPVATLVARTADERRTRETLAGCSCRSRSCSPRATSPACRPRCSSSGGSPASTPTRSTSRRASRSPTRSSTAGSRSPARRAASRAPAIPTATTSATVSASARRWAIHRSARRRYSSPTLARFSRWPTSQG